MFCFNYFLIGLYIEHIFWHGEIPTPKSIQSLRIFNLVIKIIRMGNWMLWLLFEKENTPGFPSPLTRNYFSFMILHLFGLRSFFLFHLLVRWDILGRKKRLVNWFEVCFDFIFILNTLFIFNFVYLPQKIGKKEKLR